MAKNDKAPELGDEARDIVTGFHGIVASIHKYLHGCDRVALEPTTLDKDGKPIEPHVFDIHRIEVTKAKSVPMAAHSVKAAELAPLPPGGPQRDAIKSSRKSR